MNIIIGDEHAKQIAEKYIVLELDTIQFGTDGPILTAYCVVENIPFDELNYSDLNQQLHSKMISAYKDRQWRECTNELQSLKGLWGGEVDSYYEIIEERLTELGTNPPGDDWTHVVLK